MNKTLNVTANDFVKNLYDLINSSGLPICLISYILKDVNNSVTNKLVEETNRDLLMMAEESTKKENKKEK